jgi:superfamily II DNA or RNA helicase
MENEVRDLIAQRIYEWVEEFIGRDFQFRKYQKEKIVDIIENITSTHENHTHLIEAPTGSGKSLIIIIAAGVLSKYYNLESYILCSDLFLWNQYANFIKDNPIIKFGMFLGQWVNDTCYING